MNEMLKEVYGRRFRVDQPSQTVETFDEMRYHLVSTKESGKRMQLTSTISNVISSSIITFLLTAPAIQDLWGMSSSRIL